MSWVPPRWSGIPMAVSACALRRHVEVGHGGHRKAVVLPLNGSASYVI
jgi:hypothetical protein